MFSIGKVFVDHRGGWIEFALRKRKGHSLWCLIWEKKGCPKACKIHPESCLILARNARIKSLIPINIWVLSP
jgi:hypothetical protein